jgi:PleD family two-component response regulator
MLEEKKQIPLEGGARILVADDHAAIRDGVRAVLQKLKMASLRGSRKWQRRH